MCWLAPLLLLAGRLAAAPAAPGHDVWVEGESVAADGFIVGRDPAFADCYGGAILQLQTQRDAPGGGWSATWQAPVPEAGWWEVRIAATRTDASWTHLGPYRVQVGDGPPRRIADFPVAEPYGPGAIFGWLSLGRFHLPAGDVPITVSCSDRRRSDGAYLLYVDALALRRADPPAAPLRRIAGPAGAAAYPLAGDLPLDRPPPFPLLHVVCDAAFTARVNGVEVGQGSGAPNATVLPVSHALRAGRNSVELAVTGDASGAGVVAWLSGLGREGERRTLGGTGTGWRSGEGPARDLGGTVTPWGDVEVQPMPRVPIGDKPIPIKTGNLSVELIRAAVAGEEPPAPRARPELDAWRELGGVDTVEDYLCWLPLEPQPGEQRWDYYRRNAEELHARGMRYAVYPWLHFAPAWLMESDDWDPLVDLRSGRTTFAPSIWSPRTHALFDRFYEQMRRHLGDAIDEVFVSMVTDYGEVGYPIGMADWLVPAPYKGVGWWCGDPHARADFRSAMVARHGDLAGVNAAWGTTFAGVDDVGYPPDPWLAAEGPSRGELAAMSTADRARARRRWLDFVEWYLNAMVEFAGEAVAVSRRQFPQVPHEIKIGFGNERVIYGADYTHFVKRSQTDGYTVRSTHGKLPPYFYRRFSTAARHYGVPLVTEPPSKVDRHEEVQRIFKDATSGTAEYFDYPQNLLDASDLLARFVRYLEGEHSLTEVAFVFPTTDHRLRPGQHVPPRLLAACEASRELFDWDIVDERLIADGALARYRTLLLPEGDVFEADTLARLAGWVAEGGLLIAAGDAPIETVEGDATFERTIMPGGELPPADDVLRPVSEATDAWRLDIGSPGDEPLLLGDWQRPESGHWEWGGEPGGHTKRWTGADSGISMPVDPALTYELAITVALHPKRLGARHEVFVNGVRVGSLAPQRTSVFRAAVGPEIWQGRNPSRLSFAVDAWQPSELDGSSDTRTLGVAVDQVALWRTDGALPADAPAPVVRREPALDTLARRCLRRVGRGASVRVPVESMAGFADVAAAILAEPEALLPGHAPLPALDGRRDGVWAALLPSRVLLYNGSDAPRTASVELDPAALARLGAAAPTQRRTVTVDLPPHALGSVELPDGRAMVP